MVCTYMPTIFIQNYDTGKALGTKDVFYLSICFAQVTWMGMREVLGLKHSYQEQMLCSLLIVYCYSYFVTLLNYSMKV